MELYACFRPGDLVRAEVIGLGDARSYYLSTAKNELGVVYAKSAAGGESHLTPVALLHTMRMRQCGVVGHAGICMPMLARDVTTAVRGVGLRRRAHAPAELAGDAVPADQDCREAQGRQGRGLTEAGARQSRWKWNSRATAPRRSPPLLKRNRATATAAPRHGPTM